MRAQLRAVAAETVAIVERGSYRAPGGSEVIIGPEVAAAVAGTRLHLPDTGSDARGSGPAVVEVTAESTLAAARRVGGDVACLVFASARNPGGGFLNGAQAQEESIARSSALHRCQLAAPEFYDHHRAHRDLAYSDRIIHSPRVPVIRDDDATLLDQPHLVSMLTCAAPNLAAIRREQPARATDVADILRRRAAHVLDIAHEHGHRALVLGAWGCGVFGNPPADVAAAFADALRDGPAFDHVVFAILDRDHTRRAAFAAALT